MRTSIAYFAVALSAIGAGRLTHRIFGVPPATLICGGGAESPLTVEITPERVEQLASGERLTYAVSIGTRFAARARYAIELVNDVGEPALPMMTSEVMELPAGASQTDLIKRRGADLVLPETLPDGFYELRVTAAARSLADGRPATLTQSFFLLRQDGSFAEIPHAEWFARGRASQARLEPPATPRSTPLPRSSAGAAATPAITPCPVPQVVTPGQVLPSYCPPLEPPPPPPPSSSGVANGRLMFFNHQGNYCPTDRDCTGAKYLQADHDVYLPVRDTKIYLRNGSSIIGQGTTDSGGNFSVGWHLSGVSGNLYTAQLVWHFEHKDGRFTIQTDGGGVYEVAAGGFVLHDGSTDSIGNILVGDGANPNQIANIYDGAWRDWAEFSLSNRMLAYFTGVRVQAFTTASDCRNSCADGGNRLVRLDPAAAYRPQHRVMHELGHIASFVSNRDQSRSIYTDYCYPNTGSGCDWLQDTPEWSQQSFEEGLATFYADTALYYPWATAPHSCLADGACANGHFNIEESHQAQCVQGENRYELSIERYLWDAFDSNQDYAGETLARNNYEFFDTINAFDNGRDNHQKDEPVCCIDFIFTFDCGLCNRDGRSAADFRFNWNNWGTDSSFAFANNCSPVGD